MKKTTSLSLFILSFSLISSLTIALTIQDFLPNQYSKIQGSTNQGWLGRTIKSAGDINNDGYDDILVSVPKTESNRTAVYVIYGEKGKTFSNMDFTNMVLNPAKNGFVILGNSSRDHFGFAISGAGDINNDGYDDIIIGASHKNGTRGVAYVIYGGEKSSLSNIDLRDTKLDPAKTGFTITGNLTGDYLGYSVSRAGDFNKDGYGDLVIGGYNDKTGKGKAYVIYGKDKSNFTNFDLNKTALEANKTGFIIHEGWQNNGFGCSVAAAGDVDKDGYDDIIVGAFHKNTANTRIGEAKIFYGKPSYHASVFDLSVPVFNRSSYYRYLMGSWLGGYFGYSVSGAGDINGDGYDDVIIGEYGRQNYQGYGFVIYGGNRTKLIDLYLCCYPLDPKKDGFRIIGAATGDGLGYAVSGAGDVNGDGFADIMISAYGSENYTGTAYVIYGGRKSRMSHVNLTNTTLEVGKTGFALKGEKEGDYFGYSLSSAGDINGDKYADILVSSYRTDAGGKGDVYVLTHNRCPDYCNSCDSPSKCNNCSGGFELLTGQCRECGAGEYFSHEKCESCSANCEKCFDSHSCLACAPGYSLFELKQCLQEPENPRKSIISLVLLVGCPVFLIISLVRSVCQNKPKDQLPLAKNPNLILQNTPSTEKYNAADQEEPNEEDLKKSVNNGDKVGLIINEKQVLSPTHFDPNLVIDEENAAVPDQEQRDNLEMANNKKVFVYGNEAEKLGGLNQGNLFSNGGAFPTSPPKSMKAKEMRGHV